MRNSSKLSIPRALLALATAMLSCQVTPAAEIDNRFELEIKPRVCVRIDMDEPCGMELDIVWSSSINADVCLLASEQESVLRCWEESRRGSLTLQYASSDSYHFHLQDAESAIVLVTADISVVTRDLRNLRRRRRHVWSLL